MILRHLIALVLAAGAARGASQSREKAIWKTVTLNDEPVPLPIGSAFQILADECDIEVANTSLREANALERLRLNVVSSVHELKGSLFARIWAKQRLQGIQSSPWTPIASTDGAKTLARVITYRRPKSPFADAMAVTETHVLRQPKAKAAEEFELVILVNPDVPARRILDDFCNVITMRASAADKRLRISTGVRFLTSPLPMLASVSADGSEVEAHVAESFQSAVGGAQSATGGGFIRSQLRQRIISGSLEGVRQAYGGIDADLEDLP